MTQSTQSPIQSLERAELAPIVAQVIGTADVDLLEWRVHPVAGVGGSKAAGGQGVFRLSGTARADGQIHPWSVIVKAFGGARATDAPSDTTQNPAAMNYWKRELLAYGSGLLTELSGDLIAPRCYGVIETANDELRVWIEDIQETPRTWSMARYAVAARHLGQFNGSYLAGRPLPTAQPWLYQGRVPEWMKVAEAMFERFQLQARSPLARRWLTESSIARINKLLAEHHALLALRDTLPACLCHHDAFRRNLLARDREDGKQQTVAIDWSMVGYGRVGEDVGITTAITLSFLDVPGEQARELDHTIFESYLAGLRDAGWRGDVRLARLGYTTTASLVTGVGYAMARCVNVLVSAEGAGVLETVMGHKLDDILEQWATIQPFLLDLGDEALLLADELR